MAKKADLSGIGARAVNNAKRAVAGRGPVAKFGKIDRREGKRGAKPGEAKKAVRNQRRTNARSLFRLNQRTGKTATLAGGASR